MTDLMDNQNSLSLGYYHEDQLIGISLGGTSFIGGKGRNILSKEWFL